MRAVPLLAVVGISAAAAAVLLVVAVLPAEYGVDPTGAGAALGLTGMAESVRNENFATSDAPIRTVTQSLELEPYEAVEFKLLMHPGDGTVYRWAASAPLAFEMHAHGPHMEEGEAVFLSVGKGSGEGGTYIAEFAGEHGWYFSNRTPEVVRLDLTATGQVDGTVIYRGGDRRVEEFVEG